MGDAFPDFDKMTLEEQMAWLESLAKRQGVKDEELTTKADLDIPIPEDAQIDEPGYVPFEGSASARKLKEAQDAAARAQPEAEPEPLFEPEAEIQREPEFEPQAEIEPEPEFVPEAEVEPEPEIERLFEPEPEIEPEPELELDFLADEEPVAESLWDMAEPIEEAELFADAGDAADPMLWLDSLSAQPEGELEDLFADSEAFTLEGGEQAFELESLEPSAVADEPETVQPAAAGDDPLGGMDPMLWLESLAKRQGANPDELLTQADLDLARLDDSIVIDEPGYVPFEGSASARRLKEAQEFEASLDNMFSEPEVGFEQPEAEAPVEQEMATFAEEGAPVEDSMLWLESLAKRQGANPEELLTQADLDIPELPEDTVIDEPGYVEYSPFSILPDQEIDIPEPEQAAAGSEDAALSWLEDLVAEPGEDLSQILAFGEDMFEPVDEELIEPVAQAPAAKPVHDDPLSGMTDEEVAYAQAHGQLTGEQELAWLKRQAAKLAEVRESQEAEMEVVEEEEGEALPAELPPWLLEMRDEVEQIDLEALEEPVEEAALPEESVDFSEWLEETPVSEEEAALEILGFDAAVLAQEDVESLWGEMPETEIELEEIGLPDDLELAKFLAEGIVPEGADPLAEALDAEFDRKLTGDETEPEWYTDAVAKAAADVSAVPEAEIAQAVEEQPVEGMAEASLVDMPDWLKEEGEEAVLAEDAAMPGWLMELGEPEAAAELQEPAWLAESEYVEPAADEDLPSWLRDLDKASDEAAFVEAFEQPVEAEMAEPEVEQPPEVIPTPPPPVRAAPPEPEIRRPAVVQPEVRGELLQKITQRLQQDPSDQYEFDWPLRGRCATPSRPSPAWISTKP